MSINKNFLIDVSYVSQVSQKWISISVTLGFIGITYIRKCHREKKICSVTVFVHRHFLYIFVFIMLPGIVELIPEELVSHHSPVLILKYGWYK